MTPTELAFFEELDRKLAAIERHQRGQTVMLSNLVGLFEDILDDKRERLEERERRDEPPLRPHLRLVE
jgi:hypothetical protein